MIITTQEQGPVKGGGLLAALIQIVTSQTL